VQEPQNHYRARGQAAERRERESSTLDWEGKAEYLLLESKQKSCKLFISINRPKS
jgi:hypothetical protein